MAAVLRTTVLRLVPSKSLLARKVAEQLPCVHQVSNISSKAWRDLNGIKRPPPYDYNNKRYNVFKAYFDGTLHRIDENSKIVLVEGPVAAGKSKFAQELAKELDMLYVPEPTMDYYYINSYGYDLRQLDDKLPPGARSFDTKKFLQNPNHIDVANFQLHMYKLRYIEYVDALAHLFSTGQGVVLDRSCYSDSVFVDTLYQSNLISKIARQSIYDVRDNTLPDLKRPHLVIYLDVPVDVVQKRIKERNIDYEVNSPLFKDNKYLETLEKNYKQDFLKSISTHAELLVYDWSNGGEVELVVEDIERIDFDRFEKEDKKLEDWHFMPRDSDWCEARIEYTQFRWQLLNNLEIPHLKCPELCIQPDDFKVWYEQWTNAPGMRYDYGYNEDQGDTGILTKASRVPIKTHSLW